MASGKKTGGRKKGSKALIPHELKEMIIMSLHQSGGINYLKEQARENPTSYLALIGKVLPMTVAGDPNQPLKMTITWDV